MNDGKKTKKQLIEEIKELRRQLTTPETSLKVSDEQLRTIMDSMVDIVAMLDANGAIQFVAPSIKGILGYAVNEITGKNVFDYIHDGDRATIVQSFMKVMETGKQEDSFRLRHANGHYVWFEATGRAIIDEGHVTGVVIGCRDITQRKNAENALRASETRYQSVFENTGTVMIIIEEDMIISVANAGFEKLTGYQREEIEGKKKWTEFIEKSDLERMIHQHTLRRLDKKLALPNYEFRLVHRGGSLRDVYLTVDMIPGTQKSVASLVDITERKQMEKFLRDSETKYRTLIETTHTGYVIIDQEGNVLDANPEYVRLTGHQNLKEILGRNVIDWTAGNQKEKNATAIRKCIQEGFIRNLEIDYVDSEGNVIPIEINATVIEEEGTHHILTLCRDITERRKAEEALRESEAKFRRLHESMTDAFARVDMGGRIVESNKSFQEMLGYPAEELCRMTYEELTPEKWHAFEAEIVGKQLLVREYSPVYEKEYRRKDGIVFPVELRTFTIHDDTGRPTGMWAIVRDITERRRAETERKDFEERLKRADKMEAMGTMAGGVAHDLNNVLGILVGYSELLLYQIDESSPLRAYVMNIMKGGERAAALVQDLLAMARRGISTRKVINLNQTVHDYLKSPEFMKLSSHYPYVEIKTVLGEDLLNISASPIYTTKSIMNLVSNASESMPYGGTVTIRTGNSHLDKPVSGYEDIKEGDFAVISVSDMGEGISPDDMKHIFEPFYTKKMMGRGGTGLGLSVVWGTVKDHNGYVDVVSEEGKGTTFTLYFPVTREELSQEHISLPLSKNMGKGESILVVDDVPGQRDLATRILTMLNYRVTIASSGEEAVQYLKDNTVDLVVLDMIMDPGMDGLDTYKKIIEIYPRQKAIIVSGFAESERVIEAQRLGAGAYVMKPYVMERLGMAVRDELDRAG